MKPQPNDSTLQNFELQLSCPAKAYARKHRLENSALTIIFAGYFYHMPQHDQEILAKNFAKSRMRKKVSERLKIITEKEAESRNDKSVNKKSSQRLEAQARFDREWLKNPREFDLQRSAMERQRLERTWELISRQMRLDGKCVLDLGCGRGSLARRMRDTGADVDAVDISWNALKLFKECGSEGIDLIQDYAPYTKLSDNSYNLVASLELIGDLPLKDHRLYFSELARLVKTDGVTVASTAFDINTTGAFQYFGALAETEFNILEWKFSYHLLFIRLLKIIKTPERFLKSAGILEHRQKQLANRSFVSKAWLQINTSKPLVWGWSVLSYISKPVAVWFENSDFWLKSLEKICKSIWEEEGISHAIFIGQRRPLIEPSRAEIEANEPKRKRQVWE